MEYDESCSAWLQCVSVVYISTVLWTNLSSSLMVSVVLTHECPAALAVILTPMFLETVSQRQVQYSSSSHTSGFSQWPHAVWIAMCSLPLLETIGNIFSFFFFLFPQLILIHPGHQAICLSLCSAEKEYDQRSHILRTCFIPRVKFFPWFITAYNSLDIQGLPCCPNLLVLKMAKLGSSMQELKAEPVLACTQSVSGSWVQARISQFISDEYQCQRQ